MEIEKLDIEDVKVNQFKEILACLGVKMRSHISMDYFMEQLGAITIVEILMVRKKLFGVLLEIL